MVAGDLMSVRVTTRGKWHFLPNPLDRVTPCGEDIPDGASQRALDLVDSGTRCRAQGCIEARNKAKGLQ